MRIRFLLSEIQARSHQVMQMRLKLWVKTQSCQINRQSKGLKFSNMVWQRSGKMPISTHPHWTWFPRKSVERNREERSTFGKTRSEKILNYEFAGGRLKHLNIRYLFIPSEAFFRCLMAVFPLFLALQGLIERP